jgi:hypothetical protein
MYHQELQEVVTELILIFINHIRIVDELEYLILNANTTRSRYSLVFDELEVQHEIPIVVIGTIVLHAYYRFAKTRMFD